MKSSLLFFTFFFASTSVVLADTITLKADAWCPYTCAPESDKPGFMIEIAKAIFEPTGHKIDYSLMNWARAVSDTRKGKFNAVVGANVADVPGFILPKVPQGMSANYFWTRKDSNFTYRGIDSIKEKKIGVINGYSYGGDELDKPIGNHHPSFVVLPGDDALVKLIKMADAKRIDAFVENPYVLEYLLSTELTQFQNSFKAVSKNIVSDPELYIAFSPAKAESKKYAQILSDGMKQLRKSGKLKTILKKYNIKDWK